MTWQRALLLSLPLFGALLVAVPADAGKPHRGNHGNGEGHHRGKPRGVPELDRTVAASAAVLIGGGVFVILGRRRAKR
ncbi:MAG: hypothetical protein HYS27_02215 [Deltaproteobacteria bacterium]|nr:hypothetical protein [Deltaproteobacteria bacterium]